MNITTVQISVKAANEITQQEFDLIEKFRQASAEHQEALMVMILGCAKLAKKARRRSN